MPSVTIVEEVASPAVVQSADLVVAPVAAPAVIVQSVESVS